MGGFYSIVTDDEVYAFYNENWSQILLKGTAFYKKYSRILKHHELNEYIGSEDTEFEKHLYDGDLQKYLQTMQSGTDKEKEETYKKFWVNPDGMKRAEQIKRKVPINSMIENILSMVPKYTDSIEAYKLYETPKQRQFTINEAFTEVGNLLDVKFKNMRFIWYYYYKYLYGREFSKYAIYENNWRIGSFLLEIKNSGHAQTIPLIPSGYNIESCVLIQTPSNYNLIYELTHAVQYCYNPFWKIDKGIVEIPAIGVENIVRKKYGDQYGDLFIRKQVGLALADLSSDNPQDFNKNFEKYSNSTNAYDICSRFWHYGKYDKKYYSYILGFFMNQNDIQHQMMRITFEFKSAK